MENKSSFYLSVRQYNVYYEGLPGLPGTLNRKISPDEKSKLVLGGGWERFSITEKKSLKVMVQNQNEGSDFHPADAQQCEMVDKLQ